ncbi:class C sortase [Lactococcus kimchii]|uniref:class C sortase n=1 Tax=Lactococcus sp. S-13 TaxID=2507158 RepID=UPI00102303B0|nr:class C sortase [Lactococcus sp. S-13]RZI48585.1 class C sortase [Lactococcus sp. S-13]
MKQKPSTKKGKRSFRDILSVFFALIALGALFYPIIANTLIAHKTTAIITRYEKDTSKLNKKQTNQILAEARAYNDYIYAKSQHLFYNAPQQNYNQLLRIDSTGLMGDISIPQIGVKNIPIYHGDSEQTLSIGVGHLENTSLPIGDKNTHTVLTAHSGRVNNTLFTDLDKLKLGDVFYIDSLNLKLKYKIDNIKIVNPDDVSTLGIQKGKDLATLITCYPTGVNSQRLLVTGVRVPYHSKTAQESIQRNKYGYDFWVFLGSAILAGLAVIWVMVKVLKKKKRKEEN